jgi:hypothetical protein
LSITLRRTVDRLWSITEDLNILYKENWTRLAAQEVQLFQVSKKMQNKFSEWWGLGFCSCLFDCHQRKEKLQQTFDKFKMTA